MKDGWYERLLRAIDEDPRSLRQLSMGSGLGENYVSQMIRDGKAPGSVRLAKLLDAFPQETRLFILTGIRLTPDGLEMLAKYSTLNAQSRRHFVGILDALSGNQDAVLPDA